MNVYVTATAPASMVTGIAGFGLRCGDIESSATNTGALVLSPPANTGRGVACTDFNS